MDAQLTIQENDLELVVSEKKLGSLTTNAIQIRDIVRNALPMYDASKYNDDNIDQAKKDKAALNKASKILNSKRIEIEKEFLKPFGEFKNIIAETVQLISQCSANIDIVVKNNEQQYKDKKKEEIESYYYSINDNLINLNKIFKLEWLNKTTSMKSVCSDLDAIVAKVKEDIKTIESMPEDADALRTYYIDTLNINDTIQYGNRLKEQRERTRKAEEEKQNVTIPSNSEEQTPNKVLPSSENQLKQPEILIRAFRVKATREKLILLAEFMNSNKIDFNKIPL